MSALIYVRDDYSYKSSNIEDDVSMKVILK